MSLQDLGWTPRVGDAFLALHPTGLALARVARQDRERYRLLTADGECEAVLAGRLRHDAGASTDLPATGDWVAVRPAADGGAVIVTVLPRSGAFLRRRAGEATVEQVVAANVDTVFVVVGLDADFNLRRIERYLVAGWESGAAPVVVLNKADLAADLGERLAAVAAVAPGVPTVALSARERHGLEALAPWLVPGVTVALLGSSGVGKSTLVNALVGEERQATRPVRADDSRGRHTTSCRELIRLPGGALLLDTPGMRELGPWCESEDLSATFPDVAALADGCRFRDCQHESEPGCGVRDAVERGALDATRLESWHRLRRELRWMASRRDARARAEEEGRWKAIARSIRRHPKADRWR
jgi:ribosome biogenesis GTPase / thiamine phosphate phosphatase